MRPCLERNLLPGTYLVDIHSIGSVYPLQVALHFESRFGAFASMHRQSASHLSSVDAGKYVELKDSIQSFQGIIDGKYDDLPEMAFYMVGDINEVQEKADKMAKDMAASK